jgi:hypothetical protein
MKMVTGVTRNMSVQRMKEKIYIAEQLNKCAFVSLCMNDEIILMHLKLKIKLR